MIRARTRQCVMALLRVMVLLIGAAHHGGAVRAQDAWDPFDQLDSRRPAGRAPDRPVFDDRNDGPAIRDRISREPLTPIDEGSRAVERGELAPVMSQDGSNLPHELWRGLDVATVEALIAQLELPPRSPALHALWLRLVTSSASAPSGGQSAVHFEALRAEALYRSGRLDAVAELLNRQAAATTDPLTAVLLARSEIGLGNREKACQSLGAIAGATATLPKLVRRDAILAVGYCAAASGNGPAAGLAAELARDEGLTASPGLSVLDALAAGVEPKFGPQVTGTVTVTDFRLMQLAGATAVAGIVENASPALLSVMAGDPALDPATRLTASEAAAAINAIAPRDLAAAYRAAAETDQAINSELAHQRARAFNAAGRGASLQQRARHAQLFLNDARQTAFYPAALAAIAEAIPDLAPSPDLGWFAESGIEMALMASDYDRARAWVDASNVGRSGNERLDHWLALIDVADSAQRTPRGAHLPAVERLALRGALSPDSLHRLATVLDALDYQIPIPLWEEASRTPQPAGGHLPATGVLSQLQDAAKKQEFGRTVLLAMATLGPQGAQGANILALGDAIRALRQAGLPADARRVALEAVFPVWPRSPGGTAAVSEPFQEP